MGEFIFGVLSVFALGGFFAARTQWLERGLLNWLKAFLTVYFRPAILDEAYYLTDHQKDVLDEQVDKVFPE